MGLNILNLTTFKRKILSKTKTVVFHFLLLFLFFGHFEAYADLTCKDLFQNKSGSQFLKQQEPNLHTAPFIERMVKKIRSRTGTFLQKPTDRIDAWIKYLESMYQYIQKHPQAAQKVKNIFYNQYVIKPENIPQSYFDLQARIAREQGHGNVTLTPDIKQQYIQNIIADQKHSLDIWLDYFMSKDSEMYPMWTKHWMLTGMTKLSTFDSETFTFGKRSSDTAAPFAELNREAIAYVVDVIVKKANGNSLEDIQSTELRTLLENANFGKLYGFAIRRAFAQQAPLTITKGVWVKYNQGSDHMPLVKSLEGKGTGWCTAGESTAKSQLDGGDFYVYYSHDQAGDATMPRIAIRMNGNQEIAEVRGIAKQQNMDPHIANTNILSKKMNEFGEQGRIYQTKSIHMKKLTLIENKNKKGEDLTVDEIRFLYEIDGPIQGFGYEKDPRINEILSTRNLKLDLSYVFNLKPEQISTTTEEALSGNIVFHYGDLRVDRITSAEGLILPKQIGGSLSLDNLTSAKGLILPEQIGGSLSLNNLTSARGLIIPSSFKGALYLHKLTNAKELIIPKNFSGTLILKGLASAKDLVVPEYFKGSLHLDGLRSSKDLKLPLRIDGDLYLNSIVTLKGILLPEHIGGELRLLSLQSAEGLPKNFPLEKLDTTQQVLEQIRSR